MDEQTVSRNLEKMLGNEEGDMTRLLGQESFGGNAGRHKGCLCAGANFYYNNETGEILYFGNDRPERIAENPRATFKVALSIPPNPFIKIVETTYHQAVPEQRVKDIIQRSVDEYNDRVR